MADLDLDKLRECHCWFCTAAANMDCRRPAEVNLPMPVAIKIRQMMARSIFDDWDFIKSVSSRYEVLVRTRWLRKNSKEREKVLRSAWPDIAHSPVPEDDILGTTLATAKLHGLRDPPAARSRAAYLCRFVNIVDLSQGQMLLHFLESRARAPPSAFASEDASSARSVHGQPARAHGMQLWGQDTAATYGRIVDSRKTSRFFAETYLQRISAGLITLEIQQRAYHGLAKTLTEILHDIDLGAVETMPCQAPAPELTAGDSDIKSRVAIARGVIYKLPATLDMKALQKLVKSRLSHAADHIWSLREDPSYFVDTLTQQGDHDPKFKGKSRSAVTAISHGSEHLRDSALGAVRRAYYNTAAWGHLSGLLKEATAARERIPKDYSITRRLPKETEDLFARLTVVLRNMVHLAVEDIAASAFYQASLRSILYEDELPISQYSVDVNFLRSLKNAKHNSEDASRIRLFFALHNFAYWEHQPPILVRDSDLYHDVKAFQYLMDSDAGARAMTSPLTLELFSDLALASEILHHLGCFKPWASHWTRDLLERPDVWYDSVLLTLYRETATQAARDLVSKVEIQDPFEKTFFYPIDRRRTKATTDQVRTSEARLDKFWQVEHDIRDHTGANSSNPHSQSPTIQSFHNDMVRLGFLQEKVLQRTGLWLEPALHGSKTLPEQSDGMDIKKSLSRLQISETEPESRPPSFGKNKTKTKGRGTTSAHEGQGHVFQKMDAPAGAEGKPHYGVSERDIRLIKPLFHQKGGPDSATAMSWLDFLRAMAALGFSAEQGWGSAWTFKPCKPEMGLTRSITFHQLHSAGKGGSKMSSTMVRDLGRRLSRVYGWDSETFRVVTDTKEQ